MGKFTIISCSFLIFLFLSSDVKAHPGRTAADGCHFCRTNCAEWGEVYGARHCHGTYTATAPSTPVPTLPPTLKPAPAPTLEPTNTAEPLIEGLATQEPSFSATPLPTPPASPMPETTAGNTVAGLASVGILSWIGYKGLKWLARITAPKDEVDS